MNEKRSLTDEMDDAWDMMGLKESMQIERIQDWANMLEARLKEFDPDYRSYRWGLKESNILASAEVGKSELNGGFDNMRNDKSHKWTAVSGYCAKCGCNGNSIQALGKCLKQSART